ncbi:MAG: tetratricopeptide repeat protein [bacterium]
MRNIRFVQSSCFIFLLIILSLDCLSEIIEQDFMYLLQEAENLQAEGKNREAIKIYEKIYEKISDESIRNGILINMARCYSQIGDDDNAIGTYIKIISSNPNSMDAPNAVSLMMNLYAQSYRFDEMIAMSKQILQKFPQTEASAMAIYRVASYYYSKGDYRSAITEYERLLDEFPRSTMRMSATNRLIYLYIDEAMFDKAEKLIKGILSLEPKNNYLLQQLAFIYRKQGKYDEALNIYHSIQESEPGSIEMYEQIGSLYYEKGDIEKAMTEWYKITKSVPGQYSRHQILAGIFKSYSLYKQAAEEYQRAIDLQPNFPYLYSQLAELYMVNKEFKLAADIYLKALMRIPINYSDRWEMIKNLLEICKIEGLSDMVISELEQNISQIPNNYLAIMTLADFYFYKGDTEKSLEQYKALSVAYPDNGKTIYDRAKILEREQKIDDAIRFYETIITTMPNNNFYLQSLFDVSNLFYSINKPEESIKYLKQLILQMKYKNESSSLLLQATELLGDVYFYQLHNIDNALYNYNESLKIAKGDMSQILSINMKIAECYIYLEQFDKSEEFLASIPNIYQTDNTRSQIAKIRGDIYFHSGDFEKAKVQYKTAAETILNEDWVNDALERIALINDYTEKNLQELMSSYAKAERLIKLGQYDKAMEIYISAKAKFKEDEIDFRIGELLILMEKYKEAISIYESLCMSKSSLSASALFQIAYIYWQKLGNFEKAIEAYTKLLENHPDSIFVSEARRNIQLLSTGKTSLIKILP